MSSAPDSTHLPQRLLVTGGCGFIGSNFIHQLFCQEKPLFPHLERVVNVDKLTYAGNPANVESIADDPRYRFIQEDILSEDVLEKLLREESIDIVVHFAAESHVDRSIDSPEPFFQTNVMGTLRLLNAARRHWKELSPEKAKTFRFLHVSTDEVFGTLRLGDQPFCETTPFAPNSPYAASKAASDHAVRSFFHTYAFPVIITNCSNNYGPYQFPEKLIPLMILNALEGKPLPIYGDGGQIRDWLFVEDHARAIAQAIQGGKIGETYAVGGDSEITNLQMVDLICDILDRLHPDKVGSYKRLKKFVQDRPGHDRRYAINHGKITEELGWTPSVTLQEGLEQTVRWYLEHRPWCEDITSHRYSRGRLGVTSAPAKGHS